MKNTHFLNRNDIECKILRTGKENGTQCFYYCHFRPNAENKYSCGVITRDYYNKCKKLQLITELR